MPVRGGKVRTEPQRHGVRDGDTPADDTPTGAAATGAACDEPPVRLTGSSLEWWNGTRVHHTSDGATDRSRSLAALGRALWDAGASRWAIVLALPERDEALGYRKYCDRANAEEQYQRIVDLVERHEEDCLTDEETPPQQTTADDFPLTDLGNAERLADQYRETLRSCPAMKTFVQYDGRRWKPAAVDERSRQELLDHARKSESHRNLRAMVELAKGLPALQVEQDAFDTDPYLLNCLNGTVDLRTGELHRHRPEDMLVKLSGANYDPAAQAPAFQRFLHRVLNGDAQLMAYVQRCVGYALSGLTGEEAFFLLYGPGRNGKTKFLEAVRLMLGEYATQTPLVTFLASRFNRVRDDIARLRGARYVTASEANEGQELDEAAIKRLTGGDTIAERLLYSAYSEFQPVCKIFLATNIKPTIRGTDDGIWSRVRLVPFAVTIPEQERDRQLLEKFKPELSGILAWAVEGFRQWQQQGLNEPAELTAAVSEYREEQDPLADFIAECCDVDSSRAKQATLLYQRYQAYCKTTAAAPMSQAAFGRCLALKGFEATRNGKGRKVRLGIALCFPRFMEDSSGEDDAA
mgnify:CR=1 FL=1